MRFFLRPLVWWGLLAMSIVTALVLIGMITRPTSTVAQDQPCPKDWYKLISGPEFDRCEQEIAQRRATGMSLELTQAVLGPTVGIPTPFTGPVPTQLSLAAENHIYKDDPHEFADGPPYLRGANSMWHLAALPSGNPDDPISHLYLLARPVNRDRPVTLCLVLDGQPTTQAEGELYSQCWMPPQNLGNFIIVQVTGTITSPQGPTGTVSFITTTGASGTFDLATHTWTITAAGTPVALPPPSAPQATPEDMAAPYPAP